MPKKYKRKKPKGWKPGPTPEFEPHPSVVRFRDPLVRTHMGLGALEGHTHARFYANPDCCPKCKQLDYRVQRLNTVLNWVYVLPHPNCYSEDTEVYTGRGWLRFPDVQASDAIFTLDPDTLIPEWTHHVGSVSYVYDGDLIHLWNRSFDVLTTPDHNHLVDRGKGFTLRRAETCKPHNSIYYRGAEWYGCDKSTVTVGRHTISKRLYMRLLAAFIRHGEFILRDRTTLKLMCSREDSPALYYSLRWLHDLPWDWEEWPNGFETRSMPLIEHLIDFGMLSAHRVIPQIVRQADPGYIAAFLNEYAMGDRFRRFGIERSYCSPSKAVADVLGELVMKVGGRPSFAVQQGSPDTHVVRHNYAVQTCHVSVDRVPSKGPVYCLSLPKHHTLYVRRNGKALWSGNCLCHWETGYQIKGEWYDERPPKAEKGLLDMHESEIVDGFYHGPRHVFYSGTLQKGLVQKDVKVTRGGKTFTQKRKVRDGAEEPEQKARVKGKPEKSQEKDKETKKPAGKDAKGPEVSGKLQQDLNKAHKEISAVKPGEQKEINSVPVKSFGDGKFGLVVGGKPMVMGVHAASIVVDYIGKFAATATASASGDLQGQQIQDQGRLGAEQQARKATGKAQEHAKKKEHEAQQKKAEADKAKRAKEKAAAEKTGKERAAIAQKDAARKFVDSGQNLDAMPQTQLLKLADSIGAQTTDEDGSVFSDRRLKGAITRQLKSHGVVYKPKPGKAGKSKKSKANKHKAK